MDVHKYLKKNGENGDPDKIRTCDPAYTRNSRRVFDQSICTDLRGESPFTGQYEQRADSTAAIGGDRRLQREALPTVTS
jgi:hypothetical protein